MMAKHFPNDVSARTTTVEFSKPPPPPSEPPSECPRCGSINTKFCYYNNYNKSQPRHFCKSCKRHWTKGGTLRNIPVSRRRRNKRHLPYAAVSAQPEQKHSFQNPVSLPNDQKDMSNILYQALIQSSSPSSSMFQSTILESNGASHTAGLDVSAPQNSSHAEFTFSNFTSLISNVTSDNNQSSNDYNVDNSGENPDSAEESSVAPPWPADLWSWNDEIDILGSSCDLNNLGFLEGFYQWNN